MAWERLLTAFCLWAPVRRLAFPRSKMLAISRWLSTWRGGGGSGGHGGVERGELGRSRCGLCGSPSSARHAAQAVWKCGSRVEGNVLRVEATSRGADACCDADVGCGGRCTP
eukprot:360152-Chlamydomonas_euryale.AAC.3